MMVREEAGEVAGVHVVMDILCVLRGSDIIMQVVGCQILILSYSIRVKVCKIIKIKLERKNNKNMRPGSA